MATPQVIVTLSPQGDLVAELPGLNGSRRKVDLTSPTDYTLALSSAIQSLEAIRDKDMLQQEASRLSDIAKETSKPADIQRSVKAARLAKTAEIKADGLDQTISVLSSLLAKDETTCGVLLRILTAQVESKSKLGEDGAPTAQQVAHWKRHEQFSDPLCPFCQAEGRFEPGKNRERAIKGLKPNDALRLGLEFRGYKPSSNNPNIWIKGNQPPIHFNLTPHGRARIRDHKFVEWSKEAKDSLILDGKKQAQHTNWQPRADGRGLGLGQGHRPGEVLMKRDGITVRVLDAKGRGRKSVGSISTKGKTKKQISDLSAELEY